MVKRAIVRKTAGPVLLGLALLSTLGAPTLARAEDSAAMLTTMLNAFLAQYPDTLATWQNTNESLVRLSDAARIVTQPEKAFLFGASVASGAVAAGLAGQGLAALVTFGGDVLIEAVTHRRRNAEWLQACTELRPELEKSEEETHDLEKRIRAEVLMRRIVGQERVSPSEVLRKLSIQRIEVEADRKDALARFEALNREERAENFAEVPSAEALSDIRARKSLAAEDVADFDGWLERNSRIISYLHTLDGEPAPACGDLAKIWNTLVSQERDQQNARALILRGEPVWMKAKTRENRDASRGMAQAEKSAAIRSEKRILHSELDRLARQDLAPLQNELEAAQTRIVRSCIDRSANTTGQGLLLFRIRYGRFATDARLEACIEEFQSGEAARSIEAKAAPIRAQMERTREAIDSLGSRPDDLFDGTANLHRMAIESDLQWFDGVRTRHQEVERARAGELTALCTEIAQTGCEMSCR